MKISPRSCFTGSHRHLALRRVRGASSIKVLLFIPVALVLLLAITVGFFEGRKAYWDYRVKELCAKDGGVKINEAIEVDPRTYESLKNNFGQVDIPKIGDARSVGSIAVHSYEDIYIRRNDPEIRRSELSVIRASDGVVVATSTTYSRVGGDMFALHPSYFSCPVAPTDFFSSVIHLKGNKK